MENLLMIRELIQDIDSASKGMSVNYSQADMETKLKEQMVELFGKENPTSMEVARNTNGGAFFAILEEFVGNANRTALEARFPYARLVTVDWGDKMTFEMENSDLYDVITTSVGNSNIRRQRLDNNYITIDTIPYGIKIFENFKRFMSGKTNWANAIGKVSQSYVKHVQTLIVSALYASTPVNSNAIFNVNDAGGFILASVYTMVDHVQAENMGMEVVIMGTRQALKALTPIIATEQANLDMYQNGYYTTAEGYKLVVVDQMHVGNTFNFLLSNKQLMVVPMDLQNGLVTIVQEGTPIITNKGMGDTVDMSVEYMLYTETGVGIATGRRFGKYTWA